MGSEAWDSIRLVELSSAPSAGAITGKGIQAQFFKWVLGIQTRLSCLQATALGHRAICLALWSVCV